MHRTYPKSVQPGIPRLGDLKENWKQRLIGDLFEVVKRPLRMRDDKMYRLVTVRRSRGGLQNRGELLGREISVKSQFYIRTGDFLISKRQIVHGACAVVTDEFDGSIVSNEYAVLRCKDELRLDYLLQLFHSIYIQQTFFHSSIGVHIEKMIFKLENWFRLPVNLPKIPEQQKTASFLSSVDTKIEQLGKKKSLLEQYKKGMMQKLFSQETRFKDEHGSDYPDWEEKPFGQFVKKITDSYNPATSDDNWESIELESIGQGNGKILKTFKAKNLQSVKTKFLAGDVLFGKLRPYLRKYSHVEFDGVCTSEIWVLRATGVSDKFLYFVIQSSRFNQFANIQSGSKMPRSDWKIVSSTRFIIPSLLEQQKIADFLSAIDKKIELVSTELEKSKTFKKGLLQQMFI